jgi:hypothetical protein
VGFLLPGAGVSGNNHGVKIMEIFLNQLNDEDRLEVLAQAYLELDLPLRAALDAARADLLHLDYQKQVTEAA